MSDLSTDPYALVVDDEILIRMDVTAMMQSFGFRVAEVGNAQAALNFLYRNHSAVTILFTDVQMPGQIDGFGLAREVAVSWPDISIIVASGQSKPSLNDMPPGARFIAKPFSIEVIRDHLAELLPDGKKPEPLKQAYPQVLG